MDMTPTRPPPPPYPSRFLSAPLSATPAVPVHPPDPVDHDLELVKTESQREGGATRSKSMDDPVRNCSLAAGQALHTLTGHSSLSGPLGLLLTALFPAAADTALRIYDPVTDTMSTHQQSTSPPTVRTFTVVLPNCVEVANHAL